MLKQLAIILFTSFLSMTSLAETSASITDLAWMSGSWAGPSGPGKTLEENWVQASGGSIASLVRVIGDGKTEMIELIIIEQEGDTLVLRVQQYAPGFVPRTAVASVMTLDEIEARRVKFLASGEGGFKTLQYSSPDKNLFNIDLVLADDTALHFELKAR